VNTLKDLSSKFLTLMALTRVLELQALDLCFRYYKPNGGIVQRFQPNWYVELVRLLQPASKSFEVPFGIPS